ncbi:PilT/PilU family type 4a pilus ATPase [Persephonella atlantica]|uniref:type IV pilus twitching motility protein PilT n=1 Tax=Persephonella atlantica TaxID=2699429 RepID=UPI0030845946
MVKASRLFIVNAVRQGASDIHIEPFEKELRVRYRIDGILRTVQRLPVNIKDALVARYKIMANLDIAEKRLPQDGRIRVRIDRRPIDLRVSIIPTVYGEKVVMRIQDAQAYLGLKLEDLGFEPDDLEKIRKAIYSPWGMVLVTGPTGSGKTTTLASMIDYINANYSYHIITIEDPIEYLFPHKKSLVAQREVGNDTASFAIALKYALREDPDVILVGEMRDLETIRAALMAAETGHLVFATLHTNTAIQTINRIINVFPENEQDQIRTELSFVLQGVISQRLLPRIGGGRVLVHEVLIPTTGIRNLIRENKIHQIYGLMQSGQVGTGMQTMNQSIYRAIKEGWITEEDGFKVSPEPQELERMLKTLR